MTWNIGPMLWGTWKVLFHRVSGKRLNNKRKSQAHPSVLQKVVPRCLKIQQNERCQRWEDRGRDGQVKSASDAFVWVQCQYWSKYVTGKRAMKLFNTNEYVTCTQGSSTKKMSLFRTQDTVLAPVLLLGSKAIVAQSAGCWCRLPNWHYINMLFATGDFTHCLKCLPTTCCEHLQLIDRRNNHSFLQ